MHVFNLSRASDVSARADISDKPIPRLKIGATNQKLNYFGLVWRFFCCARDFEDLDAAEGEVRLRHLGLDFFKATEREQKFTLIQLEAIYVNPEHTNRYKHLDWPTWFAIQKFRITRKLEESQSCLCAEIIVTVVVDRCWILIIVTKDCLTWW